MVHLLLVADGHEDVSRLLADTRTATLGASTEAAQRRGLFHVDLLNEQFIHVSAVVVFGVGDRGFERFEDDAGSALLRKRRMLRALSTGLPRTRSATKRPF